MSEGIKLLIARVGQILKEYTAAINNLKGDENNIIALLLLTSKCEQLLRESKNLETATEAEQQILDKARQSLMKVILSRKFLAKKLCELTNGGHQ